MFESLIFRVKRDLPTKIGQGVLAGTLASVVYFCLQRFSVFPGKLRTDCLSWRIIPFHDVWAWPYTSMMGLVGLAWVSLPNGGAAYRFRKYLLGMCAIGWLFFFFHPTSCSRANISSQSWLYHCVVFLDAPTNCFPCLHAALTLLGATVLTSGETPFEGPIWRVVFILWTATILISILALRQHTGVDVLAGSCLGFITGRLYIERQPPALPPNPDLNVLREKEEITAPRPHPILERDHGFSMSDDQPGTGAHPF